MHAFCTTIETRESQDLAANQTNLANTETDAAAIAQVQQEMNGIVREAIAGLPAQQQGIGDEMEAYANLEGRRLHGHARLNKALAANRINADMLRLSIDRSQKYLAAVHHIRELILDGCYAGPTSAVSAAGRPVTTCNAPGVQAQLQELEITRSAYIAKMLGIVEQLRSLEASPPASE